MNEPTVPELAFGETPFDRMTHEELLLLTKRQFDALVSAQSALRLLADDDGRGFWGHVGTGGKALEKVRQCVAPIYQIYGEEQIYRKFYRLAVDLLYEDSPYQIKSLWCVCDHCGKILSTGFPPRSIEGDTCQQHLAPIVVENCPGRFRKLQWSDLIPKVDEKFVAE